MKKTTNEQQFIYEASNGTKFKCERADFRSPIQIKKPVLISKENYLRDIIEMTWYHVTSILPTLNGFAGYDTLKFKILKSRENI